MEQAHTPTQAIDPVCGMTVDTRTATITSEYKGQTYYFCAPGCKKAFDREPEKYAGDVAAGQPSAS
jgi:YHS domain-containing protein